MPTELIPHQTITTIVENVAQAQADVQQAFTLLTAAKQRLRAVLGHHPHYYDSLWEYRLDDSETFDRAAEASTRRITQNAWRYILTQTGVTHYMTERRHKELAEQLKRGDFPALTVANVLSTLEALTSQVGSLLDESVKEVFDWLRPTYHHGVGALKTNKKFQVGQKVIIGYAVETNYGGGFHLNYAREASFRALGNVFSLLDGKGAPRYPDDLVTQLTTALTHCPAGSSVHVAYFHCKPFRNGNLHVTFMRLDLLNRLNQIGGDATALPGTEHTRSGKDTR
jgi:hypothetical protein